MSKISSMSSGAIDPIAQSKRVFFRADTTTASLKVGQPVCYNSNSVLDHKERASDPTHLGLTLDTYAEGEQEFTGRLFVVEEPLTINLQAFAGIVKALGPKAGADGDMIEIWVPNGAVIPVYTDQYCTNDTTIMGIRDSEADVSYPGRPIGIAKETKDRSGTAGLVWTKVDPSMFLYQYHGSGTYAALNIPDECGAAFTLNAINVTTAHTAGKLTGLQVRIVPTGAGHVTAATFEIAALGDVANIFRVVDVVLWLEPTANWIATYADGSCAVRICIGSSATHPNLTGKGLSGISFQNYLVETAGAPTYLYPFWFHCGAGSQWDGLFYCDDAGLGIIAMTQDKTFQVTDKCLPVKVGGVDYWILLSDSTGA